MAESAPRKQAVSLLDLSALIVGYGLASLLIRAYWPRDSVPSPWALTMIGLVYTWLGLAMSGPIVLLFRSPAPAVPEPGHEAEPPPRTWAELAWMIIGFYWIGLTILVVPARLNGARFLDSAFLGVFPVLAALVIWRVGPRRAWATARPRPGGPMWTHQAAIGLLVTWPLAWIGLIALARLLI